MKPLIVLFAVFAISSLVIKWITKQIDYQLAGRIAMACMLLFTAIGHFVFSKGMTAMLPNFLPYKSELVFLTGLLEIGFAIGLLLPRFQQITGWVLIIFFVLILPSNIKAALERINYQTGEPDGPGPSYLWFRVPMQLLLIAWVYLSSLRQQV
ncbi:hypothetical protein JMN32_06755 [Fulvivirga sp. 29W222]|uniref:DoxX family membrane protein n=1 Tax=Fulvivirga marina TaxID=2494733 RepID=A0A937FX39_9BACT|nr:hypothetical protein [Fulvivirga marina]MBL6446001.1 hypothetical protein [Fulvivirga marina]